MSRFSTSRTFPAGIAPFHGRGEGAGFVSVLRFRVGDDDAPDVRLGIRRIVLPEFDAIHIVVGKPQARMMQMVAALARDIFHRESARDDLARSGSQRSEKRLIIFFAVMKDRERLAVDVDGDIFRVENSHLRGQTGSGGDGKNQRGIASGLIL